jgi:glutathione S-transferase
LSKTIPNYFRAIEKRLKENTTRTHVVGDKYTIADFSVGSFITSVVTNEASPLHSSLQESFNSYVALKEFTENFRKDFAGYFNTRPQPRHIELFLHLEL